MIYGAICATRWIGETGRGARNVLNGRPKAPITTKAKRQTCPS